ncbi:hypothetical protein HP398_18130 [Brevibacillus sp. HB1.4B]|uniref:hypothetical protein n=1 Tax=Brevibacillus TaxID=55080 RepID=UPI00037796B1|nr:hypothetical protein [Brevibacillus sp. HB1.4B]ATF16065.1 hypothetical protein A616_30180 [Brevibacillus brevis X23]NRS18355.1 hypothetical protein [Brevibacillus sp. HB1.4B]
MDDNWIVWFILGPFVFSLMFAGPLIGLLIAAFIRFTLGFRGWLIFLSVLFISFVYYLFIVPSDTMLGELLVMKVAMAVHTAVVTILIMSGIEKIIQLVNKKRNTQKPMDK